MGLVPAPSTVEAVYKSTLSPFFRENRPTTEAAPSIASDAKI